MFDTATGAYGTVSVGTSATLIRATKQRGQITIQNVHASNVLYIGTDSSVDATNGLKLASGESFTIVGYFGPVYGLASGASTDTRYFVVS